MRLPNLELRHERDRGPGPFPMCAMGSKPCARTACRTLREMQELGALSPDRPYQQGAARLCWGACAPRQSYHPHRAAPRLSKDALECGDGGRRTFTPAVTQLPWEWPRVAASRTIG